MQQTDRLNLILILLLRYRLMRRSDISRVVPGSSPEINRKITEMEKHGYVKFVERRQPYYKNGRFHGSESQTVQLDRRGAKVLDDLNHSFEYPFPRVYVPRFTAGSSEIPHTLFISSVMSKIEASCLKHNVRFVPPEEIGPMEWKIEDFHFKGVTRPYVVKPDFLFGLEFPKGKAYFTLEADRQMSITRSNSKLSSVHRKLKLLCHSYDRQKEVPRYKKLFGINNLRHLMVTKGGERRVNNIIDFAGRQLPKEIKWHPTAFWFTSEQKFEQDALFVPWLDGDKTENKLMVG